jgi:hypothetical protein
MLGVALVINNRPARKGVFENGIEKVRSEIYSSIEEVSGVVSIGHVERVLGP